MKLIRWDQTFSTEGTNAKLRELALLLTSEISDTEKSDALRRAVMADDYPSLCSWSVDYSDISVSDAIFVRQVLALYQKREDLEIGVDKLQAAVATFTEAENLCRQTNEIFKLWGLGRFMFPRDVERVLFTAQRKISSLLGDVPSLSALKGRFGPGATTQLKKKEACARAKLSQRFACSEEFLPILVKALEELPAWVPFTEDSETAVVSVEIHVGKIHFVPKNAKTYRAVGPEPMLNGFFQLGVGAFLAKRLLRVGIDISDQSRNQKLARKGSIDGSLATLDLSSASDTVAIELVAHLLPYDWFDFLSMLRTGVVDVEGTPVKLQKFSTMGNGFTFPLETLIFWALASACAGDSRANEVSVYGDDIIVPADVYPLLVRVLTSCGFLANASKSFASGPFRESCGADYLSGINIRPVYLKDRLSGESAFTLHNAFVERGMPDAARAILNWIDPELQLWGPCGYGDGHLHSDQFSATPHKRAHRPDPVKWDWGSLVKRPNQNAGWGGYTFETYTWRSRKTFAPMPGDFVFPSYSIYERGEQPSSDDRLSDFFSYRQGLMLERAYGPVRRKGRLSHCFSRFSRSILQFSDLTVEYDSLGNLGSVLPGIRGYKRIKIYTLEA